MAKRSLDPFISYYQRELEYLRRSGHEFAQAYPKIAHRLDLGPGETGDPHVERLIESFAFLSARLQREIDDQYPLISEALLSALYPQFTTIIPPLTIGQLHATASLGKVDSGVNLKKGEPFYTHADQGESVQFTLAYDTQVWPIKITEASIHASDAFDFKLPQVDTTRVLRLRLSKDVLALKQFKLDKVRFYLDGDRSTQNILYQLLFSEDAKVWAVPEGGSENPGPVHYQGKIKPVGFDTEDLILKYNDTSHSAYALLLEYFYFPQKFMFFDVVDIAPFGAEETLDIFISVPDHMNLQRLSVRAENFKLGCAPLVNLFSKMSEPIGVDGRSTHYKLFADYRREETMEVHSIKKLYVHRYGHKEPIQLSPYFGFDHYELTNQNKYYWYSSRVKAANTEFSGTDLQVSFVDLDMSPDDPPADVVYGEVLCTNRALAHDVPQGAKVSPSLGIPVAAHVLSKPTRPVYPHLEGETQWKLISHLSLNHLSLSKDTDRYQALREMLTLYASLAGDEGAPEVQMVKDIKTRWVTRRFGNDGWRGFVQGTQVEVTMSEESLEGNSGLLLASVLNQFFALHCTVNSFTELALKIDGREGIWKTWQPNSGESALL